MGSDSSVFVDKFLHLNYIFICFAHQWKSQVYGIFTRGHITFEPRNPIKILCSSNFLLSKTFAAFEGFCSILPQFEAKFDADMMFFEVCSILGKQNLQMEQHTVVLNKTLLNKCMSHNLISPENISAGSALSASNGRSSCWQQ
jgi:hypothetical protein